MIELLKLCGYDEKEVESELPRVNKAFNKLGITAEDIERGKKRLIKYYHVELKGIRKIFRLVLRELVDLILVRDESNKKIIYGFMGPGMDLLGPVLVTYSDEVFPVNQSWALQIVVGCIFGKIEPILEVAEKQWLKAGMVAHCANVKTLLGPMTLGLFPKPDLLATSGFLCETSPKTLDLFHELYDIPVWYVDSCQDRGLAEGPEPTMRNAVLMAKSLRKLVERIQEVVGFEITDEMLIEVQDARGRVEKVIERIRNLVGNNVPLPVNPALENIYMCMIVLTLGADQLSEAVDALDTLYEELQERVAKGLGVVDKDAPRVLAMLPMGQTDPRLEHLACEVGIAIVASDISLRVPIKEKPKDPYLQFGVAHQTGSMNLPVGRRIPMIVEGCRKLKVDGVLDRYHVGCRIVAGDAILIESALKKAGIPVLLLEWENFDPRVYKHEEYKDKLEIFKAMMTKK